MLMIGWLQSQGLSGLGVASENSASQMFLLTTIARYLTMPLTNTEIMALSQCSKIFTKLAW